MLIVSCSEASEICSYHFEEDVPQEEKHLCPCCDCRTLDYKGGLDICPVCFWQDDGQGDEDAHVIRHTWNYGLSLYRARRNYIRWGAVEIRHRNNVRPPREEEMT